MPATPPQTAGRLFRAPWVVPVTSPVLSDGAVVVTGDRITAIGPYTELSSQFSDLPQNHCSGILLPALVNCHIHLDLSCYGTVAPKSADEPMCDWIRALLEIRQKSFVSPAEARAAAEKTAIAQYASGVGLLLDIGNADPLNLASCPVEIVSLLEMLGPSTAAAQAAIEAIDTFPSDRAVTGHAPYSTAPDLLRSIKERCRKQDGLFSLHLAENADEFLLLRYNEGCFQTFLEERGASDTPFPLKEMGEDGVVGYLRDLGIMDSKTICVHCVHLTERELEIITDSGAGVCLCPGSNQFLGVGRAPLEKMVARNILPGLGTDSIASNPVLDMWREMSLLRSGHPQVPAETIFAMATLGGAQAMGRSEDYGSLEVGKTARFLQVEGELYEGIGNKKQLLESLTTGGLPPSISWLNHGS